MNRFNSEKKYEIGETIIKESSFLHVSNNNFENCVCCLKSFTEKNCEKKRCSICKITFYCSKECQVKDWKKVHKIECKKITEFQKNMTDEKIKKNLVKYYSRSVRLMGRVLLLKDNYQYKDLFNNEFLTLVSNISKINELTKLNFSDQTKFMINFLNLKKNEKNLNEITEYFGKLKCNCINIFQQNFVDVGIGLFLKSSKLNHSCNPNSTYLFDKKNNIIVKAIKPIEKNEEITINYCDIIMTKNERKRFLRLNYFFDCKCRRCRNPKNEKDMLLEEEIGTLKNRDKRELTNALSQVNENNTAKDRININKKVIKIQLKQYGFYHVRIYSKLSILCKLFIDENLYEEGVEYNEHLIKIYEKFLSVNHPLTIYQYMILLKLYWFLQEDDKLALNLKKIQTPLYNFYRNVNDDVVKEFDDILRQFYLAEKTKKYYGQTNQKKQIENKQ